jgi:hypothetical protein
MIAVLPIMPEAMKEIHVKRQCPQFRRLDELKLNGNLTINSGLAGHTLLDSSAVSSIG